MIRRAGLCACLWLTACGGDPVLDPIAEALEAYDVGRAALARGDRQAARAAFAEARTHQPDDPTLAAWEAWAVAEDGDPMGALGLLDAGLGRWPAAVDLRMHRAALRARSGDLTGAGADLRALYAAGALHPRDAAADPDLALLASHPETRALVPAPALAIQGQGEAGAVLLGDTWTVEVELRTPADQPVALSVPPLDLLRLEAVVEERLSDEGRDAWRRVRVTFRAIRPGAAELGPIAARSGAAAGELAALPVEIVTLPGRSEQPVGPTWSTLPLASALGAADPTPSVAEVGGLTVVTAPADARVEFAWAGPEPVGAVRVELRADARSVLQRWVVPVHPAGRVTVRSGGLDLLDQALTARPDG